MGSIRKDRIKISIKLSEDDFLSVSWPDRGITNKGLTGCLRDCLIASLESRIREQLNDALVAVRIKLERLGQIIARDVLIYGGVQTPAFELWLDTNPSVSVEEFRLEPPVVPGYQAYEGWKRSEPYIRRRKSMATRKRHFIKLKGLFIPARFLPFKDTDIDECDCPKAALTTDNGVSRVDKHSKFFVPGVPIPPHMQQSRRNYIVWICNTCGKRYTCECFRGVMERVSEPGWQQTIPNYLNEKRIGLGAASETERRVILRDGGHMQEIARRDLKRVKYREAICHFCRDNPSTDTYRGSTDPIIKRYLPYIMCEALCSGVDTREAENRIREKLGIPHIGEGWVSQTQLYYWVRTLFPDMHVEREVSPKGLGRLRFDIFLPEVGVAIEYQGEQHYRPVERFGGEEGFKKTRERDRLKRRRAKDSSINLVEFKYNEILTDEIVLKRIKRAMK